MTRSLSLAFGLVMVAAATVPADGPALIAAAVALVAVLVGVVSRVAATLAVVATALALALASPSPVIAGLAGLTATVYLALRHGRADAINSLTVPTMLGALGLSAAAVLGAAVPVTLPWVPLIAPLALVASYLMAISRYV